MPIGNPTLIGDGASTSSPTLTIVTTAAVVSGNCLVVIVGTRNQSIVPFDYITSVTDGTNSYTRGYIFTESDNANSRFYSFEAWVCPNATAVASGASLVITYNSGSGFPTPLLAAAAVQISGLATSSVVDTAACAGAAGLNTVGLPSGVTSGALSQTNEIVLGGVWTFTQATVTEDAAFTNIDTVSIFANATYNLAYQQEASTAAVTYNPSVSFVNTVIEIVVPLKGASGLSTPTFFSSKTPDFADGRKAVVSY